MSINQTLSLNHHLMWSECITLSFIYAFYTNVMSNYKLIDKARALSHETKVKRGCVRPNADIEGVVWGKLSDNGGRRAAYQNMNTERVLNIVLTN